MLSVGHNFADFYMQSAKMSKTKEQKMSWVFLHALCYWGSMFVITLPCVGWNMFIIVSIAATSHFIIDAMKYLYKKYHKRSNLIRNDSILFIVDQVLHFCCLFVIAYVITIKNIKIEELDGVAYFFDTIHVSERNMLAWILALLLIYKPSAILIQKILKLYKPSTEKTNNNIISKDNNTGRVIGMIERTIMLIFLAIGQYSSVGLVLTAKSIARYDKISKEQDFAEYYLLGTLLSTIVVVLCSFILV